MLQDMLGEMKLDSELRSGKGNSIGNIGRHLNYVNLPPDLRNLIVKKLQQWINEGKIVEVEKMISQMGALSEEDIRNLFENDTEQCDDTLKLPMKWYKISSIGMSRIKQLTTSGRLVTRIQCEDGDEVGQRDWDGDSPSLINERHIMANPKLFPVLDKTVNQTYLVSEQLRTEIIVIDVSASMSFVDKWLPVQLFLFNRITAVERGEIILKIILFGAYARQVEINGEKTFTKNSNIKALERWAYNLHPNDGWTRLNDALIEAKQCINPKGQNTITVFTDEGSTYITTAIPTRTTVNTICVEQNSSMMNLCQRTGGRYYRFSELML